MGFFLTEEKEMQMATYLDLHGCFAGEEHILTEMGNMEAEEAKRRFLLQAKIMREIRNRIKDHCENLPKGMSSKVSKGVFSHILDEVYRKELENNPNSGLVHEVMKQVIDFGVLNILLKKRRQSKIVQLLDEISRLHKNKKNLGEIFSKIFFLFIDGKENGNFFRLTGRKFSLIRKPPDRRIRMSLHKFLAVVALGLSVVGSAYAEISFSPETVVIVTDIYMKKCNIEKLHPLAKNAVAHYLLGTGKVNARQVSYFIAMLNPEVGRKKENCLISFGRPGLRKDKVYPYGYDPENPSMGNIYIAPRFPGENS